MQSCAPRDTLEIASSGRGIEKRGTKGAFPNFRNVLPSYRIQIDHSRDRAQGARREARGASWFPRAIFRARPPQFPRAVIIRHDLSAHFFLAPLHVMAQFVCNAGTRTLPPVLGCVRPREQHAIASDSRDPAWTGSGNLYLAEPAEAQKGRTGCRRAYLFYLPTCVYKPHPFSLLNLPRPLIPPVSVCARIHADFLPRRERRVRGSGRGKRRKERKRTGSSRQRKRGGGDRSEV